MSGSGYGYYYPSSVHNFSVDPNKSWSEWSLEQQQYNNSVRNAVQHHSHHTNAIQHHSHHTSSLTLPNNHSSSYSTSPRQQNFYNSNSSSQYYQQRRFTTANQSYPGLATQQSWQRNNYNKRTRPQDALGDSSEPKGKIAKKKKKPLSQNIPSRKDWTMKEAEEALMVEKEFNKRHKNHSLIIKFPDLELNRDIVSKFHQSIENVHFQQPSTPRFCFVTLQESADADSVISSLNKIKFGDGYLTAEYKKDREEDQNIGPDDIDPCTLYVGNLAQEITKEDMVSTYPKSRRIDIGYAKKMKYTRYAFVSFKNVTDSLEAFKKTHSTQMYSKSLIVRFRRLHGTVGMPGESKPQSPSKPKDTNNSNEQTASDKDNRDVSVIDDVSSVVSDTSSLHPDVDLSVVKQEIGSSDEELVPETNSLPKSSPFLPGSIEVALEQHRPMIKEEIKQEDDDELDAAPVINFEDELNIQANISLATSLLSGSVNDIDVNVTDTTQNNSTVVKNEHPEEDSDEENVGDVGEVNFGSLLNQLDDRSLLLESLRKSVP